MRLKELVRKLSKSDFVVCDPNDKNIKPVIKNAKPKIIDYTKLRGEVSKLRLKVEGEHNKQNAKTAFTVSKILKIKKKKPLNLFQSLKACAEDLNIKARQKNARRCMMIMRIIRQKFARRFASRATNFIIVKLSQYFNRTFTVGRNFF